MTRSVTPPAQDRVGARRARGSASTTLELQIRYFVAAITSDRQRFRGGARAGVRRVAPTKRSSRAASSSGTVDDVCDTLLARRAEWGVSYVVLGDDTYEAFAPVVARLAGT